MTDYTDLMTDLETMGVGDLPLIFAIGAVPFNLHTRVCAPPAGVFYELVSPLLPSGNYPNRIEPGTVRFWLKQATTNPAAAEQFEKACDEGISLTAALFKLSCFIDRTFPEPGFGVWGNGAMFDNRILTAAYQMGGGEMPWDYRQDRCFRTIRALCPDISKPEDTGTYHNALHDALWQVQYLARMLDGYGLARHLFN